MSASQQVVALTVLLAVILDLYLLRRYHSRSLKKEREDIAETRAGLQAKLRSVRAFLADLWHELWLTERRAAQGVAAFCAIGASVLIGVVYSNEISITIYPFLFWVCLVAISFFLLYPASPKGRVSLRQAWPVLALLAAAFAVRAISISSLPPGLHTDEHGTARFVQQHVFNPLHQGKTINPFVPDSNFQPALYDYLWRLSIGLFGFNLLGARMSSVIAGTLAVGATYFMVNQASTRRVAWLTAILMAVYHYHVHWSRLALDNIWTTFWVPLTVGLFLRGWNKHRPADALWAGLALGLTAYFYVGGYFLLPLLAILIWQVWRSTEERIRFSLYIGKMLSIALVVAAPLLVFAARFPERFVYRAQSIYAWNPIYSLVEINGSTSRWNYFLFQLGHSFGAYNFYPDITGFYAPGIPFLIGIASVLFLWGVGWALYKKQFLPVLWIVLVTTLGGMMIFGTPSSSHFIGAIPAICWLVAIPIDWLMENKRTYWGYSLFTAIILTDLIFYFVVYASRPSPDLVLPFPVVEPYSQNSMR